ncbi:KilA domain-containing protein [Neolewinella xylanilytica]|uniref:KilA domain-containing protein n=1 Tax=Neolewinella xylanilytica TaxID=1514080 RepID=A0A2S6HZR9_9BACT|nr:KilA-N domain-containing protein [Neolewinella xylanilytica]PPK83937.1 KilA domain-containing protein [Neolewinella xylanilytica]
MSTTTQHEYKGQLIAFEFSGENNLINATQMAQAFPSKKVNDFLRLKNTKEFVLALEARYGNSRNGSGREVLRVVQGGTPELQGTWMDELLAIKFAGWLNPEFEIWMYERIRELLLTGKTSIPGVIPQSNVIRGLRMIVAQLEQQEVFNTEIRNDVDFIRDRVGEIEAKITSVDDHYYTIAGYCGLHKIPCPLHKAKEWGKAATLLSKKEGIETGAAHDERFGKVRTYHEDVLKEIIK